jgi:hypothetical protein
MKLNNAQSQTICVFCIQNQIQRCQRLNSNQLYDAQNYSLKKLFGKSFVTKWLFCLIPASNMRPEQASFPVVCLVLTSGSIWLSLLHVQFCSVSASVSNYSSVLLTYKCTISYQHYSHLHVSFPETMTQLDVLPPIIPSVPFL